VMVNMTNRMRIRYNEKDAQWCGERNAAITLRWQSLYDIGVTEDLHKVVLYFLLIL